MKFRRVTHNIATIMQYLYTSFFMPSLSHYIMKTKCITCNSSILMPSFPALFIFLILASKKFSRRQKGASKHPCQCLLYLKSYTRFGCRRYFSVSSEDGHEVSGHCSLYMVSPKTGTGVNAGCTSNS